MLSSPRPNRTSNQENQEPRSRATSQRDSCQLPDSEKNNLHVRISGIGDLNDGFVSHVDTQGVEHEKLEQDHLQHNLGSGSSTAVEHRPLEQNS